MPFNAIIKLLRSAHGHLQQSVETAVLEAHINVFIVLSSWSGHLRNLHDDGQYNRVLRRLYLEPTLTTTADTSNSKVGGGRSSISCHPGGHPVMTV